MTPVTCGQTATDHGARRAAQPCWLGVGLRNSLRPIIKCARLSTASAALLDAGRWLFAFEHYARFGFPAVPACTGVIALLMPPPSRRRLQFSTAWIRRLSSTAPTRLVACKMVYDQVSFESGSRCLAGGAATADHLQATKCGGSSFGPARKRLISSSMRLSRAGNGHAPCTSINAPAPVLFTYSLAAPPRLRPCWMMSILGTAWQCVEKIFTHRPCLSKALSSSNTCC